jgi:flagellar hook capping protein FlgD
LQRLLSTATLVGLLIATAAAFAITEKLKLAKSPITAAHLVPAVFSPAHEPLTVEITLRRADRVAITIEDVAQRRVRTLAQGRLLSRGSHVFYWNGRTDAHAPAPDGVYLVTVHLAHQRRTILLPDEVRLDSSAPAVESARVSRDAFSPDGDHQADSVTIHYRLSKPAQAVVYLNGRIVLGPSHSTRTVGKLNWYGRGSPAGGYTLEVGAVDLAGNETAAADRYPLRVEIRFIVLANHRITGVAPGARFDIGVSTDAKHYGWRLGSRHGFARGPVLTLRAPALPGTYPLTVTEHRHSDRAVVVVG